MKKILALALSAAVTLSGISAFASGRIDNIYDAIANKDEIHIIYNDKVVQYDDVKPINANDRVMIPFRAALENMGASVDYNAEDRTVSATKGKITIGFELMDDTIYINNDGIPSEIKMDVPMIISQDRTFVPIRFMSNAFGMQVGWEGDSETVVIMDYTDYFDDFAKIAPNMTKLMSYETPQGKKSVSFDADLDTAGENGTYALNVSGNADFVSDGSASSGEVTLTLGTAAPLLSDAKINAVIDGTDMYIQTDALKQIASSSSDVSVKAAAMLISGDKWYKIDLERLLSGLGMDERTIKLFGAAMQYTSDPADMMDILMSGISTEGDAEFTDVTTLATQMDLYEEIDKYISVTDNGGETYSASINITPEQFGEIVVKVLGSLMTDEEKSNVLNNANVGINASISSDGTKKTSDVKADIKLKLEKEEFNLSLKLGETTENGSYDTIVTVPSADMDITDAILTILSLM